MFSVSFGEIAIIIFIAIILLKPQEFQNIIKTFSKFMKDVKKEKENLQIEFFDYTDELPKENKND